MSGVSVKLVSVQKPEQWLLDEGVESISDLIAFCARVSNPSNQYNNETADKLIAYLKKHKHWSPFEMVNVCLAVDTPRDIGRQMLRHRSFCFQEFCVAEGTKISVGTKSGRYTRIPIEKLYKRFISKQYWEASDKLIKVYDEKDRLLKLTTIKEVFDTGVKPVYELILDNGKRILATKEHKFLTPDGFVALGDLNSSSFVGLNGVPLHQNKTEMLAAKTTAIATGGGVQYMANYFNVSYHTIRKWLRIHGVQFTKKEVASFTPVWNKGLPKEEQPRFNKFMSYEKRKLMSCRARKREESNLFSSGNYTTENLSWRRLIANRCKGFHLELLNKQNFKCAVSGVDIDMGNSEVDHIQPVYSNPELAFEFSNLQVLHKNAHRQKSIRELAKSKTTACFTKVKSITYIGERQTYDIEVDHTSHNYVANGIITHNSQRYADGTNSLGFTLREARLQDEKNRQNSVVLSADEAWKLAEWETRQREVIELASKHYEWAIKNGIAKECARVVLPEGNTMSRMYVNGNIRSWIHYLDARLDPSTQKEHRALALGVAEAINTVFPGGWL